MTSGSASNDQWVIHVFDQWVSFRRPVGCICIWISGSPSEDQWVAYGSYLGPKLGKFSLNLGLQLVHCHQWSMGLQSTSKLWCQGAVFPAILHDLQFVSFDLGRSLQPYLAFYDQ